VYDEEGKEIDEGQGYLVLTKPWPGMLRTLYEDDDRFIETYWERYGKETYLVGDAARKDEDGYIWVLGRIDDVVNVSGHRMSTAEVESAIVSFEHVAECAVIGKQDEDSGQAVVAFVTMEGDDTEGSDELEQKIRDHVAKKIGKFARPKQIIWSADLPKTRSGKIMRRLLRDIAEGNELGDVTTLREPGVMQDLEEKVKRLRREKELFELESLQHFRRMRQKFVLLEQRAAEVAEVRLGNIPEPGWGWHRNGSGKCGNGGVGMGIDLGELPPPPPPKSPGGPMTPGREEEKGEVFVW